MQNEENDEYMLNRLISEDSRLKAKLIEFLAMCHARLDEMIPMQRISAETIIQLLVDAEFYTIFDVSYTNSSTVDVHGTVYLRALKIKLWDLHQWTRGY